MIEELWKDVVGYEVLYMVSNIGNVISLDRYGTDGRVIKGKELSKNGILTDKTPYLSVSLYKDNKKSSIRIHRLIAQAFLEIIPNKTHVNHIDGNKKNNILSNLEWVDRKENAQHAHANGLMDEALIKASEATSKEVVVRNILTNEIEKFKNQTQFSLHIGYNEAWFAKAMVKYKNINVQLRNKGYELIL